MLSCLDAQRLVRIGFEAVIVPKVNVGVVSVHALLQTGNVIQMFAGIAGLGDYILVYFDIPFYHFVNTGEN